MDISDTEKSVKFLDERKSPISLVDESSRDVATIDVWMIEEFIANFAISTALISSHKYFKYNKQIINFTSSRFYQLSATSESAENII